MYKKIIHTSALSLVLGALMLCATWFILNFNQNEPVELNAASIELIGWAWASGNDTTTAINEGGVGWISLNCKTGGVGSENICATNNYAVSVSDSGSHTLSGFAWSENIGWIKFGDLSGCPAGSCDAEIISDGGEGWEMTGWARACSVFESGCSGAVKDVSGLELGGWDGWISLNCENTGTCATSDYAVRLSKEGNFASAINGTTGAFAWGDINLNWVNFTAAGLDGICAYGASTPVCSSDLTTSSYTVSNIWCEETLTVNDCADAGLICSPASGLCVGEPTVGGFTVTPTFVRSGDEVTVTWEVTDAADCQVTGGGLEESGLSGTATFNPTNQTNVSLVCDGIPLETVTVTVVPAIYES